MCGISGIINFNNTSVTLDEIKKITDIISHRGPDGEGFHFYKNLAIGHRRLSIIDLTDSGKQPMEFKSNYVISFNGEVYNYVEIKLELLSLGYQFNSNCDTEVILASYCEWGINCVHKLNGMFSFVILDKSIDKVFIVRDRFGVKPLYYKKDKYKFTFGSEIKQLLSTNKNRINKNILIEYILTGIDNHTEDTYFEDIFSLMPGHYLMYDLKTNEFFTEKWYSIKKKDVHDNFSDSILKFLELLKHSISLRLRSDVKVGTCLSGGLDSSTIAAIASRIYNFKNQTRITAIHAQPTEETIDESNYAMMVSNKFDLDLHIIKPTVNEFISSIDEVIYAQEEPFPDTSIFMSYFVSKKAKDLGCKVMLNGQGADEILLGYERYLTILFNDVNIFKFLFNIRRISNNNSISILDTILMFIYFNLFFVRSKILLNRSYLKKDYKRLFNWFYIKKSYTSQKDIVSFQLNEIQGFQLSHLLRYEDRNSMINSIESRLPFLDYRLVEASLSFPKNFKLYRGWTKYILRKSVESILPKEVVWRKFKLGFNGPDKTWLNDYDKIMFDSIIASPLLNSLLDLKKIVKNYKNIPLNIKWKFYNISRWESIFKIDNI